MSKKLIPMKINKLTTQLKTTTSNPSLSEEDKCIICIVLQEKLNQLELTKHNKTRDHLAAKIRLENESPASKFWAKAGKEQKPRDIIVELRTLDSPVDTPTYEQRLDKMSELAREYYNSLQQESLSPTNEREDALGTILNNITIKLSPQNQ